MATSSAASGGGDYNPRRMAPIQDHLIRPVQRGGIPAGKIPWPIHVLAWRTYHATFGNDQTAERIAERGGFSWVELLAGIRGDMSPEGMRRVTEELMEIVREGLPR